MLFGPSYGQINYWSPVLVFLAREQRRPIFQYLALWDQSLGLLQRTRYITPNQSEELLFTFGPYVYLWYDPTVAAEIEENLPLSFEFPEPEVNEAYLRASYKPGDIVAGMKKGGLIVHAGGRPVLVDQLNVSDINHPAIAAEEMLVADDGRLATIRCVGPTTAGLGEQIVNLSRPGSLMIRRKTSQPIKWWYSGDAPESRQYAYLVRRYAVGSRNRSHPIDRSSRIHGIKIPLWRYEIRRSAPFHLSRGYCPGRLRNPRDSRHDSRS